MQYQEIEDIAEIRKLNDKLVARLSMALSYSETRIIGFPAGHENRPAFFNKRHGEDALWWAGWNAKNGTLVNLWGHGKPGEVKTTLTIDAQFNLPSNTFHRRLGGAFLREVPSGKIVLAHRGIVTLGHGRFPRARLFDAMGPSVYEAETTGGIKEFLLIAELNSKTLLQEISAFSYNLRTVLRNLTAENQSSTTPTHRVPTSRPDTRTFSKLQAYLAEFAGKRRAYKPKKVQADCHHGLVVAALEKELRFSANILNSIEIDLVADRTDCTLLFEVKTSSSTQNVYTAIGQLSVHAPMVAKLNAKRPVIKVMVLPEQPMAQLSQILSKQLGIRLIQYIRPVKGNITFLGLDKL